jgi:hypothetical protein
VYLQGGGFELMVDGNDWQFYSDTPGVRFILHKTPANAGSAVSTAKGSETSPALLASRGGTQATRTSKSVTLSQILPDGEVKPLSATLQKNQVDAVYPANAAYVLLK